MVGSRIFSGVAGFFRGGGFFPVGRVKNRPGSVQCVLDGGLKNSLNPSLHYLTCKTVEANHMESNQ